MSKIGAVAMAGAAATFVAPAFVAQGPAPSTLPAREVSLRGAAQQGTSSSFVSQAAAATAATLSVAALAAGKSLRPRRVARRAESKFAGGLIGGQSAFSSGDYNFDPLGLSVKCEQALPYFREAELKHGRIAMLAWVGLVVPDFVRIPGERYSFEAIPNVLDAHDKLNGAVGVNMQILFWIGIVELCSCKKVFEWNSLETAGDYGLTMFFPADEEGQKRMRLSELKNGRLAMVAFGAAITQAVVTRHPFPWLY